VARTCYTSVLGTLGASKNSRHTCADPMLTRNLNDYAKKSTLLKTLYRPDRKVVMPFYLKISQLIQK
jgi:hypothetical protein